MFRLSASMHADRRVTTNLVVARHAAARCNKKPASHGDAGG
jgi:hypothetical protein